MKFITSIIVLILSVLLNAYIGWTLFNLPSGTVGKLPIELGDCILTNDFRYSSFTLNNKTYLFVDGSDGGCPIDFSLSSKAEDFKWGVFATRDGDVPGIGMKRLYDSNGVKRISLAFRNFSFSWTYCDDQFCSNVIVQVNSRPLLFDMHGTGSFRQAPHMKMLDIDQFRKTH